MDINHMLIDRTSKIHKKQKYGIYNILTIL